MKELKGSKTEANLLAAFAGESQARNKYTYYASKAKKDGYEQIAELFTETANNEKEHAKIWFKLLHGGIGSTPDNLKDAAAVLAELPDRAAREVYAMRVAETAGMPAAVVTDEVQRQRKRRLSRARKERERDLLRPATAMQPPGRSIRFDDPRSAAAEQGIIKLLYLDPGLFRDRTNVPDAAQFSSPELRHIYTVLLAHGGTGTVQIAALSGELSPDELALLTGIIQQPAELANGARALDDYISILQTQATAGAASSEADLLAFAKQLKEHKGYGGKDGTERT